MNGTLSNGAQRRSPRHAPRIATLKIRPDKIRDVIGPGGKVIRGIVEETGCKIDIEDDGTVFIASSRRRRSMQRAIEIDRRHHVEAQVGKIYKGKVRRIVDFGAFVEIMPGTDGLLHISQIGPGRVQRVSDVLKEGDEIQVKVLEIDRSGKIRLSRKEAMATTPARRSTPPRCAAEALTPMVRRSELPNGIRIVSERMAGVPSATVGIWVENGSRFEPPRAERHLAFSRAPVLQGHRAAHGGADRRGDRRGRRRAQRLHRQGIHLLLRAGPRRAPRRSLTTSCRSLPALDA